MVPMIRPPISVAVPREASPAFTERTGLKSPSIFDVVRLHARTIAACVAIAPARRGRLSDDGNPRLSREREPPARQRNRGRRRRGEPRHALGQLQPDPLRRGPLAAGPPPRGRARRVRPNAHVRRREGRRVESVATEHRPRRDARTPVGRRHRLDGVALSRRGPADRRRDRPRIPRRTRRAPRHRRPRRRRPDRARAGGSRRAPQGVSGSAHARDQGQRRRVVRRSGREHVGQAVGRDLRGRHRGDVKAIRPQGAARRGGSVARLAGAARRLHPIAAIARARLGRRNVQGNVPATSLAGNEPRSADDVARRQAPEGGRDATCRRRAARPRRRVRDRAGPLEPRGDRDRRGRERRAARQPRRDGVATADGDAVGRRRLRPAPGVGGRTRSDRPAGGAARAARQRQPHRDGRRAVAGRARAGARERRGVARAPAKGDDARGRADGGRDRRGGAGAGAGDARRAAAVGRGHRADVRRPRAGPRAADRQQRLAAGAGDDRAARLAQRRRRVVPDAADHASLGDDARVEDDPGRFAPRRATGSRRRRATWRSRSPRPASGRCSSTPTCAGPCST